MYRLVKILLLGATFIGLCPPLHANTTGAQQGNFAPRSGAAHYSVQLAQTDLSLAPGAGLPLRPGEDVPQQLGTAPATRVALLLPLLSDVLRPAAEAVRAGFLAAHERDKDGIGVTVVETGDAPQDVLSGYLGTVSQHDIVVGPLTRSGVSAVAESGSVSKPTLALTQLESTDLRAPQQMLVIGLSLEDEARQAAAWATANKSLTKAYVISTDIGWQQRAAAAFSEQWERQGRETELIELQSFGGYLEAKALQDLRSLIVPDKSVMLFLALDAVQAMQLRSAIGDTLPMYGTSQLNPFILDDRYSSRRLPRMDGTRLLDIPWQLRPDHPTVMLYAPSPENPEQKRSADLERLYALGIDAYRIAREIAFKQTSFGMNGATGKLTVRFDQSPPFFERKEEKAVYRNGLVIAVGAAR